MKTCNKTKYYLGITKATWTFETKW